MGTDKRPCIGVVLAGGRSRRMGQDKALLIWRGRPLIEHLMAVLRVAEVDSVQVSGERPGYQGIADRQPDAGPVAGLASVAGTLNGEPNLLVIPVDMPLLGTGLLSRLRTEQPAATCLCFANHVLPMRLRLDARCRAVLDRLLQADEARQRSLHALQQALGKEEIPLFPGDEQQFTDCNTPASWDEVTR